VPIHRRKRQVGRLFGREPAVRLPFHPAGNAAPRRGTVKKQDNRPFLENRGRARLAKQAQSGGIEREIKLFGDLANQGLGMGFPVFDLAAGEFPQPGMVLSCRALLQQQPPGIVADRRRHDFQHCRDIFHHAPSRKPNISERVRKIPHRTNIPGGDMQLFTLLGQIRRDNRGATAVEYGLIVSLIVISALGAYQGLANATTDQWDMVSDTIDAAINKGTAN